MGEQIVCFIRKRMGKCLWYDIQKLDEMILEKKTYFNHLQAQMKYYEQALKTQSYLELIKYPFRLYDGYDWNSEKETTLKAPIKPPCVYSQYDCHDLYRLKQDVFSYHMIKLSQLLLEYNQLTCLLLALKGSLELNQGELKQLVISFNKSPIYCIGYIFREKLKFDLTMINRNHSILVEMIYTDTSLVVSKVFVPLFIQKDAQALEGTCLMPLAQSPIWIQIQLEARHIHEGLVQSIIKCLHQIAQEVQRTDKKKMRQLAGSYIDIGMFNMEEGNQLIDLLTPLGYQVIGKMKSGEFKSNQLLVYRKK